MGIPLLISMIQSDRERLHRLSTERKQIASNDGKIKVTVPGTWMKMPGLNKFASLQVGDERNRMYLIVVPEAKADVPSSLCKHMTNSLVMRRANISKPQLANQFR
jgi:hypothetical protein